MKFPLSKLPTIPGLAVAVLLAQAFLGVGSLARAQVNGAPKSIGPRSLFPSDYNLEIRVDVARLEELGLLAEVQRSPAVMLLAEFRRSFGFPIDELIRITYAAAQRDSGPNGEWISPQSLWVFEGSERVAIQADRRVLPEKEPQDVGNVACVFANTGILLSPRAGLLFYVDQGILPVDWVRPILSGKTRGGVAMPQLTELTTARGVVASVASILTRRIRSGDEFLPGLPDAALSDSDPIQGVRVMLFETEGERLSLELRLRFAKGTDGSQRMLRELIRYREGLSGEPFLKPVMDLIGAIRFDEAGADAVVTLDLGAGRIAERNVSRLVMLVAQAGVLEFGRSTEALEIEEVAEEIEEAPLEEPPPAKEVPPPSIDRKRRQDG
ncbi:MAG: hypothetical protein AB7I19_19100 [Planctomycetota bacterium]